MLHDAVRVTVDPPTLEGRPRSLAARIVSIETAQGMPIGEPGTKQTCQG